MFKLNKTDTRITEGGKKKKKSRKDNSLTSERKTVLQVVQGGHCLGCVI